MPSRRRWAMRSERTCGRTSIRRGTAGPRSTCTSTVTRCWWSIAGHEALADTDVRVDRPADASEMEDAVGAAMKARRAGGDRAIARELHRRAGRCRLHPARAVPQRVDAVGAIASRHVRHSADHRLQRGQDPRAARARRADLPREFLPPPVADPHGDRTGALLADRGAHPRSRVNRGAGARSSPLGRTSSDVRARERRGC